MDTLVQRGYAIRKEDEADRRKVVLTLSAKGWRVHDKIELVASAQEVEFLSVLKRAEYKALLASLDKLERHSSVVFDRRRAYERRHFAGESSRRQTRV